jgi:putative transposase
LSPKGLDPLKTIEKIMSIKVEPFTVGNFVHAYNRGNKKAPIFFSKTDYWRFLRILRFFNDERNINEFANGLTGLIASQKEALKGLDPFNPLEKDHNTFDWQEEWGQPQPLVEIVSYCLMPNHFHLLLREITTGGISKFMKKVGAGYTVYQNSKKEETGRLFQGQYKGKTIQDENYLQYLDAYIQVINPMELCEGGIMAAMENFDRAFQFAIDYPFCSLGEAFGSRKLNIIKRDCFKNVFDDAAIYKEFCREALLVHSVKEYLGKLALD